jgi:hypothetical protein
METTKKPSEDNKFCRPAPIFAPIQDKTKPRASHDTEIKTVCRN